MTNRFSFLNGQFLQEKDTCLHVSDLAIQRGYGVFDYCRTNHNVPLYLEDHIDRFFKSAEIMHLVMPVSKSQLGSIILELAKRNNISQSGIRMLLTGGYSPDSYEVVEPNLVILQHPMLVRTGSVNDGGVKIITHEYVREFPGAKTINYSMGIWLQERIRAQHATDVLYYLKGEVSEFPRANFFIVTNEDVILTPKRNILHGITRKKILELASDELRIEESVVTFEDIRMAKEAFMTSTTKRIVPIVQVDNITIGSGRQGELTTHVEHLLAKEETLMLQ